MCVRVCVCVYLCKGVPGELYYVRDGQVNEYALGFTLPLHTNVTRLFFDWFDDSPATHSPVKLAQTDRLQYTVSQKNKTLNSCP